MLLSALGRCQQSIFLLCLAGPLIPDIVVSYRSIIQTVSEIRSSQKVALTAGALLQPIPGWLWSRNAHCHDPFVAYTQSAR